MPLIGNLVCRCLPTLLANVRTLHPGYGLRSRPHVHYCKVKQSWVIRGLSDFRPSVHGHF